MNRFVKASSWSTLIGLLLAALLVAAVATAVGALGHGTIQIDGEPLLLGDVDVGGVAGGLIGVGGAVVGVLIALVVAAVVVCLVVPLAVLMPVLLVSLVVGGGLLFAVVAVAGAAALACSPLILLLGAVWLVWRLVRRAPSTGTGATIVR